MGPNRVLKAEWIIWLCTDRQSFGSGELPGRPCPGGARIDGTLDLSFAKISYPLSFQKCSFSSAINLRFAELAARFMYGSRYEVDRRGGS